MNSLESLSLMFHLSPCGRGRRAPRGGRGEGAVGACFAGGPSRPSMASEALGLLPIATPLPNPSPTRGEGLKSESSS